MGRVSLGGLLSWVPPGLGGLSCSDTSIPVSRGPESQGFLQRMPSRYTSSPREMTPKVEGESWGFAGGQSPPPRRPGDTGLGWARGGMAFVGAGQQVETEMARVAEPLAQSHPTPSTRGIPSAYPSPAYPLPASGCLFLQDSQPSPPPDRPLSPLLPPHSPSPQHLPESHCPLWWFHLPPPPPHPHTVPPAPGHSLQREPSSSPSSLPSPFRPWLPSVLAQPSLPPGVALAPGHPFLP